MWKIKGDYRGTLFSMASCGTWGYNWMACVLFYKTISLLRNSSAVLATYTFPFLKTEFPVEFLWWGCFIIYPVPYNNEWPNLFSPSKDSIPLLSAEKAVRFSRSPGLLGDFSAGVAISTHPQARAEEGCSSQVTRTLGLKQNPSHSCN